MNNKQKEITAEEFEKAASDQGRKLGVLLASLDLSDEEFEAWLTLIPQMSLEQIDRLTNLLETAYTDASTENVDKELSKEMESIQKEYENEMQSANEEASKDIEDLKNKL